MISQKKGQASIEAALVLPILVAFIGLIFLFFASTRSYFWAQYQLHEAIICLQDQTQFRCKTQLKSKFNKSLTFWKAERIQLFEGNSFRSGKMHLSFRFIQSINLEIEKRIYNE